MVCVLGVESMLVLFFWDLWGCLEWTCMVVWFLLGLCFVLPGCVVLVVIWDCLYGLYLCGCIVYLLSMISS